MGSKIRKPMYDKIRKELPDLIKGNSLSLGGDTPLRDLFEDLKITNVNTDDAQDLQYGDNTWDNVISDQMLEHLPRPWDAVNEMFRVCKPGGYVICTTCSWNPVHRSPKDYYRFMPDGMEFLFSKFEDVIIGSVGSREAIVQDLKHSPNGGKNGVQDIGCRNKIDDAVLNKNEENFPWLIWAIARKPVVNQCSEVSSCNMDIDVYTFCWNEEVRLPYFLQQWAPVARKITIYDNGSTDKSKEIALKYPSVVWDDVTYGLNEINNEKLTYIKNNCWKQSRDADLCFVGDIDEFSYHPMGLLFFLYENYQLGFTAFKGTGYDMVSDGIPVHNGDIFSHRDFQLGYRRERYDKVTIFSPKHIKETNYSSGAHTMEPEGNVKMLYHNDFKLLHYKFLSKDYFVDKTMSSGLRLSDSDRRGPHTKQYLYPKDLIEKDFNEAYSKRVKII